MNVPYALPVGYEVVSARWRYTIVECTGADGATLSYRAVVHGTAPSPIDGEEVALVEFFPTNDCRRDTNGVDMVCNPLDHDRLAYEMERYEEKAKALGDMSAKKPGQPMDAFRANDTVYYACAPMAASKPEAPAARGRRFRLWPVLLMLAALAGGVGVGVYYKSHSRSFGDRVEERDSRTDGRQRMSTSKASFADLPIREEAAVEEVVAYAEDTVEVSEVMMPDESVVAITPDLLFHDLQGPVRSLTNEFGQVFYFDTDGRWTNDEYSDQLTDRSWSTDNYGRRTAEYYTDTDGERGVMYHSWDSHGRVYRVEDTKRKFVSERYFDSAGNMTNKEVTYDPSLHKKGISQSFTDYQYDSYGNWVQRKCGSRTQTRKITYY